MENRGTAYGPIAPEERILSLDVLRGFAVLGILIMNIQSFAMIEAAYINPTAYGDLGGINRWVWIVSHIFADQKFLSIFSMLFGAGILLVTGRMESNNRRAVGFHYRRTLWLLVIGMLHAYLLWNGDILVTYGLCSLLVFLLRKMPAKKLFIFGLIIFSVATLISLFFHFSLPFFPPEAYEETLVHWKPNPEHISAEVSAYLGSWQEQMTHRVPSSIQFQTFIFITWFGWRAGGLMLVGMALFKWGVFTLQRSNRFYLWMMSSGFCVGLPLVILGVVLGFTRDWSMEFFLFLGRQFNYWGSLFVASGYVAIVMLACRSKRMIRSVRSLAAVGRMALTNYLLQTFICTTIFYGHGLGMFGRFERKEQILIVSGIWIIQLILSPIWLRYFRFGPAEWIWRSLTYLKLQPIRKAP